LTFVFSINCLTGEYDIPGECFAETFHRHAQGAVGILAASEISYSFVNDTYVWGMYDYYWPDFMPASGAPGQHKLLPAFGNAAGKIFLEGSSWPYNTGNKEVTYHLFHHHGDAFQTVFSEVPQSLTVIHDDVLLSGVDFLSVTADEHSLIGISINGELLAAAQGTGSPVTIPLAAQLPGVELIVTVTKQNHYRYSQVLPVIPPEGPFVIFDSVGINDRNGNSNGALDYNEDVTLHMTVHNVGVELSTGVTATISTDDVYTTVIDEAAGFGDILPDDYAHVVDGYRIVVSQDVPDGHVVPFTVVAADADSFYTSTFTLTAWAPNMVLADYEVTNDADSDGVLDPGENGDIEITLSNEGHSLVTDLTVTLASLDEYVQVNTASVEIPSLAANASVVVIFNADADPETPIGQVAELHLEANGPLYAFASDIALSIGLSIEDFESGYLVAYPWETSGNADWAIDSADAYEGGYSAKSGAISHSQMSDLSVRLDVLVDGTISFWYKVSSESGYDYLEFLIDDVRVDRWAGSVGWAEASFPVTAGIKTFSWRYSKDSSVSTGSDCGWVDYIIFPSIDDPPVPIIAIGPESLEVSVEKPETSPETILVENNGEGDLEYHVSVYLGEREQSSLPTFYAKKDVVDPRVGESPGRGSGGPDQFGYTWIDSDEAGGPVYDWVEISSLGTVLGHDDDGNYGPYGLGFDFPFYGTVFNEVRICTNGWLSFTATNTTYNNQGLPNSDPPNNLVCPFWEDLDPGSGGDILVYADEANQRFIVEYNGVHHYPSGNPETFQAILKPDGSIVFQYQEVVAGTGCTVGIENADGSVGLQVVANSAYLHSEHAILISSAPLLEPWLAVSPMAGTVYPGSSAELVALFSSVDVDLGDYEGSITITTNDPNSPIIVIPVSLHVVDGNVSVADGLPAAFALSRAYPNPFNPTTKIDFAVPINCKVNLSIFDLAGRLVRTLVAADLNAGHHSVIWNGKNDQGRQTASGTYYYRLEAGDYKSTQKMILVK